MPSAVTLSRTSTYQSGLAWFAALGGLWVFVLVMLGAFTTSIGAGMIFLDWPLSNGSLNPEGWLSDIMMFAEHSHRLSAGMMSIITLAIAVAVWCREDRKWVRQLAWFAVALVFTQALVGGMRVLLDHLEVETVNTSVGRLFAMLHACLAQIYVCTLLAIALSLSRAWIESREVALEASVARWARWCCGLLVLQLAIAAVMRHSYAGLAIPTFPFNAADGGLLPPAWNFRVGIHFAHRVMAVVLSVALLRLAVKVWRAPAAGIGLRTVTVAIAGLLIAQISLGASVIWMNRNPYVTTGHVLVGALLLATTFGLTMWLHRSKCGGRA